MTFFKTHDLPTAAFLLFNNEIQFHGLEERNPMSKYFLFTPAKKAEQLAMEFMAGKSIVNARLYADAIRRAKEMVLSGRN